MSLSSLRLFTSFLLVEWLIGVRFIFPFRFLPFCAGRGYFGFRLELCWAFTVFFFFRSALIFFDPLVSLNWGG